MSVCREEAGSLLRDCCTVVVMKNDPSRRAAKVGEAERMQGISGLVEFKKDQE